MRISAKGPGRFDNYTRESSTGRENEPGSERLRLLADARARALATRDTIYIYSRSVDDGIRRARVVYVGTSAQARVFAFRLLFCKGAMIKLAHRARDVNWSCGRPEEEFFRRCVV